MNQAREDDLGSILYETLEILENLLIELRYGTVVHLGNNEQMLDDIGDLRIRMRQLGDKN